MWRYVVAVALSGTLGFAAPVLAQHEHHDHEMGDEPEQFGEVHFDTSCNAEAQQAFNRAVALLHSFWFRAATDAFHATLEKDPSCAISYWGLALANWGNPLGGMPSPQVLQEGWEIIQRGLSPGPKTERERMYVEAAAVLYRDADRLDHRMRTLSYEKAMEALWKAYPDDGEAAIYYALALNITAPPTDKTYRNQLKAAAILEEIYEDQPEHPGVAHYIIHTFDFPPLAERGLPAARAYAKIAPSAPHALHMPSHIFTRLGYWDESIASNIASAEAAERADSAGEVLHAWDYMVYAYLQSGRDGAAGEVLEQIPEILRRSASERAYSLAGSFAAAAITARYALERSRWSEAAALEPRPAPGALHTEAMTHFARAVGAARSGNPAAARPDLDRLAEITNALSSTSEYWSEQVEIQHKGATAWVMYAEGREDEAVALLRETADQEDLTEKNVVTPGPLAPAREMLGDMLLEMNRPADALVEFEATAAKEPNRFRGVFGAARAADLAGEHVKARQFYEQLLDICANADTDRDELQMARRYLDRS